MIYVKYNILIKNTSRQMCPANKGSNTIDICYSVYFSRHGSTLPLLSLQNRVKEIENKSSIFNFMSLTI